VIVDLRPRGIKVTIHYELILLYAAGITPKVAINDLGFSRGTAYRFYRIYRLARERAAAIITHRNSDTPEREKKSKNLDHLPRKKGRPPSEKKPVLILNKETGEYERLML